MTILTNCIDRALPARTPDRQEFQRMIHEREIGLFDVVPVWKLDRFSRDRYDSAHDKRILKKNGVRVISARENIADGGQQKAPFRTKASKEYLLTTKLLCGDCGRLLVAKSGTSGFSGAKYCYQSGTDASRSMGNPELFSWRTA